MVSAAQSPRLCSADFKARLAVRWFELGSPFLLSLSPGRKCRAFWISLGAPFLSLLHLRLDLLKCNVAGNGSEEQGAAPEAHTAPAPLPPQGGEAQKKGESGS